MPTYKTSPYNTALQSKLVIADDIDTTGVHDATGAPGAIFAVDIRNGAATTEWLNIYDNGNPVIGTTEPELIFPVGSTTGYVVYIDTGIAFASALSMTASNAPGGGSGASPANLDVRVFVSNTVRT